MDTSIISAQAAYQEINDAGLSTYIDVRTVAEFVEGRPKGNVINIPIVFFHPTSGNTHTNEAFVLVANHTLSNKDLIIVGADEGDRCLIAAKNLVQAGFLNVRIMQDGLLGWRKEGLPVTGDNRPGVSYVSLLTPARRAKPEKS